VIIGVVILTMNFAPKKNATFEEKIKTIEPEETFTWSNGNLSEGKKIIWDWEVEQNLAENKYKISFWIEDSKGMKYNETESALDKGSFTVPYNDIWTLKWKNPYSIAESYSPTLEIKYKVGILNQPPTASIQTDKTSGPAVLTVSFRGAGLDYDGVVISYLWDFGDGNKSTLQNPTHMFTHVGTYTVSLTVTDNDGASGKDAVAITVEDL